MLTNATCDVLEIYLTTVKQIPERTYILRQYYDEKEDGKFYTYLYILDKDYDRLYKYLKECFLNPKIKHVIPAKRFRHFFFDKEMPKIVGYDILN